MYNVLTSSDPNELNDFSGEDDRKTIGEVTDVIAPLFRRIINCNCLQTSEIWLKLYHVVMNH